MAFTGVYQGIDGAHSKLVLDSFFKTKGEAAKTSGASTFRQVAIDVLNAKADVGVLPIDNAIAGTVREGYDLLAEYELVPIAEVDWRMDQRLLGVEGALVEDIREVEGHPLILEECGRFLGTLAGVRVIPVEDTGVAARDVARAGDKTHAAIGPPEAGKIYGLAELAANIADHPENYTRFIIFAAPNAREEVLRLGGATPEHRKTSILLSTLHEAGSLARCMDILAEAKINLSKLESKPKLGKAWEYLFYLDFEGDVREPRVADAIAKLRAYTQTLHVVGSYDTHNATQQGIRDDAPPTINIDRTSSSNGWNPELMPASAKHWPKAARTAHPAGSHIRVGPVVVGDGEFVIVGGPCAVESRDQVIETAKAVHDAGAVMLRGGVFKPRSNPYSFQGMGWEGAEYLAEAGRVTGMPTISEVMSIDQVEGMARYIDVLQIGARNMQNFDLLKAVGRVNNPILLKRGMSASIEEWIAAAEYILAEGNPNVILCERGIRTFETSTRNTLDLSAVPVIRERTHLPIMIDPSHGVGVRRWVRPLCRAAKALGAHGLLIEVHPNPAEAKCDGDQSLTFADFRTIMRDLSMIPTGDELERVPAAAE
jgi:3-deoxy-7-phosphoheptulonate synthase